MGDRYAETDETTSLLYIDANNLYGWAMSQPLPTGGFKEFSQETFIAGSVHGDDFYIQELQQSFLNGILNTPDDAQKSYFVEVDFEYPQEIKQKTKNFPFAPKTKNPLNY